MAVLSGIGGLLRDFWVSFRQLGGEDATLDNLGEGYFKLPCWEASEIGRRRPLDTGPTISGDCGREVSFADPLMITIGREYSRLCRSSCS